MHLEFIANSRRTAIWDECGDDLSPNFLVPGVGGKSRIRWLRRRRPTTQFTLWRARIRTACSYMVAGPCEAQVR